MQPETQEALARASRPRKIRTAVLLVTLVALLIAAHASGLLDDIDPATVRATIDRAGPLGFVVYIAAFAAGVFLHVPGLVFVASGVLAYGRLPGFVLGWIGGLCADSISFAIIRAIGGKPLSEAQHPFVKKMLARLDTHPVSSIATLRVLAPFMAALNYTLALTAVRFRDFALGTAIGIVPAVLLFTLLADWGAQLFAWGLQFFLGEAVPR